MPSVTMAPDSQCLSREGLVENHHSFMTRVLALPALDQAATMYRATKEQQPYVGGALRLVEAGFMKTVAVTGVMMPLATPIANHVLGGWEVVDDWACQWLDNIVKAAPIISKPTDEIVHDTRHFMMESLAGQHPDSKPLTFKEALAARASNVVVRASTTDCGRVIFEVTDSILLSAHHAVDTYLPPAEGDLHHADGSEGDITTKAFSLAYKTQARLRRSALQMIENDDDETNEDDDIVIYPLHLVENEYYETSRQNAFIKNALDATAVVKTKIIKNVEFLCQMTVKAKDLTITTIKGGVSHIYLLFVSNGLIDMGKSTASRGLCFGHLMATSAVGIVCNVTCIAKLTAQYGISTAMAIKNSFLDSGMETVKGIVSNGTNMAQESVMRGLTRSRDILADLIKNIMTHNLTSRMANGTGDMHRHGSNVLAKANQCCTDSIQNGLLMIPPSVYVTGHTLYVRFLLSCCVYLHYPHTVLENSCEALKNTKSVILDSCVWGADRKLFITIHLFQERWPALLKTISLQNI